MTSSRSVELTILELTCLLRGLAVRRQGPPSSPRVFGWPRHAPLDQLRLTPTARVPQRYYYQLGAQLQPHILKPRPAAGRPEAGPKQVRKHDRCSSGRPSVVE